MLVELLSVGRAITLPSTSSGSAQAASYASGAYAVIRKQFNTSIANFEGVGEALTHAKFSPVPLNPPTRRYYQNINRDSGAVALASDFAMLTLGGDLKKT